MQKSPHIWVSGCAVAHLWQPAGDHWCMAAHYSLHGCQESHKAFISQTCRGWTQTKSFAGSLSESLVQNKEVNLFIRLIFKRIVTVDFISISTSQNTTWRDTNEMRLWHPQLTDHLTGGGNTNGNISPPVKTHFWEQPDNPSVINL